MCNQFDCRAYRRNQPNRCGALINTNFSDKAGKPKECPFYKTLEEWRAEVKRLKASGHVSVDKEDLI